MDLTAWPRILIDAATKRLLEKGAPQWWIDGFFAEVLDGQYVTKDYVHRAELHGNEIQAWQRKLVKLRTTRDLEGLASVVAVGKAYILTIGTNTPEEHALAIEFLRLEHDHFDPRVKDGSVMPAARKAGGDTTGKKKKEEGEITATAICNLARTLLAESKKPSQVVNIIHTRLGYSKPHIRETLQAKGILEKRKRKLS